MQYQKYVFTLVLVGLSLAFGIFSMSAEERGLKRKMETRLEETELKVRIQAVRPGFRCMLLSEGSEPAQLSHTGAFRFHSLTFGPLKYRGVLKELSKPFQYGINSSVYRHTIGCRGDFSLNPVNTLGTALQWADAWGLCAVKNKEIYRWAGWGILHFGDHFTCVPVYSENWFSDKSGDTPADTADVPLQTSFPKPLCRRRIRTAALSLLVKEGRQECRILSAAACAVAGRPSFFGRVYLNLSGTEWLDWRLKLLGKWIGRRFPGSDGRAPEEKASLAGFMEISRGRSGINIRGKIYRDKIYPIPQRFTGCGREMGGKIYTGLGSVEGRSAVKYAWKFDEAGLITGEYMQNLELKLEKRCWKCGCLGAWAYPFSSEREYSFKCTGEIVGEHISISNMIKGDWQRSITLGSLEEWSASLRWEYRRKKGNCMTLWVKMLCRGDPSGSIEFPLSLGMKAETE